MTRYFPELVAALKENLPPRCVVDGEIILVGASGDRLDFDTLQQRIHPAASRVKLLAEQTPASLCGLRPAGPGRRRLHRPAVRRTPGRAGEGARRPARPRSTSPPPPRTRTRQGSGSSSSKGQGWTGSWPSRWTERYQPDKRVMFKIKHERTADCVVAGYRVHKSGPDAIGSLLLGLYKDDGGLASVGVIGAFPMKRRQELFAGTAAAGDRLRRPSMGLGQAGGRGADAPQRRGQPLERRQGPVLRAAPARTGGGGPLRPHGRREVPPHGPVQPLAAGPGSRSPAPTRSWRSR